jgi:serine protease Do
MTQYETSTLAQIPALSGEVAKLAERARQSVVLVQAGRGRGGSGVIWSAEGLVISNAHVVPGDEARVTLPEGGERRARVIARAEAHDLVALQVEGARALRPADIGASSALRVGEIVAAVGNPLGMRNAVTLGVVSGLPAPGAESFGGVLQLSLTLRPGNSGGALFNARGEVVGIPHMIVRNGLALAVPSEAVAQLLRGELGTRGRLGIGVRWVQLPASFAARAGLPGEHGL